MAYLRLWMVHNQVVSVGMAVFLGVIANYYGSYSGELWVLLTAFLVSQTTRGTPLRQGLLNGVSVVVAIFFSSLLMQAGLGQDGVYGVLTLVFVLCGYVTFANQWQATHQGQVILPFFLVLIVALFSSPDTLTLMRYRFFDVIIGAVIGILCRQWVFPVRFEKEFRRDLMPILTSLYGYSQAFTDSMTQREKTFPDFSCHFPEWVYESGFNPGLRSGFRYFLLHLERVSDLFFSMSYLASQPMEANLFQQINGDMVNAMQKNTELLKALIDYFESKKMQDSSSDFTSDIKQLEQTLQGLLPPGWDVLEIRPHYMTLIGLVRDIKDMRGLLLQLVMALPADTKATPTLH